LLTTGLGSNAEYSIELLNMRDKAGNKMLPTTLKFSVVDLSNPRLTNVSPARDSIGVAANTSITLTFNEPMDQSDAQRVFSTSPSFPGSFSWNANSTAMTFFPRAAIAYGQTVTWSFNRGKDASGNFSAQENGTFKIIREITTTLQSYGNGHIVYHQCNPELSDCGLRSYINESVIRVGDRASDHRKWSNGFMTFAIHTIPVTVANIQSARLVAESIRTNGDVLVRLGKIRIGSTTGSQNISEPYSLPPEAFDYGSNACTGCPVLVSGPGINADITELIRGDLSSGRINFSNIRLSFETATDNDNTDDYVDFNKNPTLTIKYLIP
jgi:Bacterial Ig-like domain